MRRDRSKVVKLIDDFLAGRDRAHDWDEFISIRISGDPELELLRRQIAGLPDAYPVGQQVGYCNPDGLKALREIVDTLKKRLP